MYWHSLFLHSSESLTSRSSKSSAQATAQLPPSPTPMDSEKRFGSLIPNVQQVFLHPPNCMPPDPPKDPSNDVKSPAHSVYDPPGGTPMSFQSKVLPSQLFDETSRNGSLFSLRIPDVLLSEESPLRKEGKFGKLQVLDNGESRLVIGDCYFRLVSPGVLPYSTVRRRTFHLIFNVFFTTSIFEPIFRRMWCWWKRRVRKMPVG